MCPGRPLLATADDLASQAELLAPVWRDQADVLAVLGNPVPREPAVGQDGQLTLPGSTEARLHEDARDALAAEPVVGLGVRERDLVAAQVVLGKPS